MPPSSLVMTVSVGFFVAIAHVVCVAEMLPHPTSRVVINAIALFFMPPRRHFFRDPRCYFEHEDQDFQNLREHHRPPRLAPEWPAHRPLFEPPLAACLGVCAAESPGARR